MSYHGTNATTNFNSLSANNYYRSMQTITNVPFSAQEVLNPTDAPMKLSTDAYNRGMLSPYQNNQANMGGAKYYSVYTGYGRDPENLYTLRACTGSFDPYHIVPGYNVPAQTRFTNPYTQTFPPNYINMATKQMMPM